ncbi:MAG: glycosyltransferase family 1 protein [Actinomycetota bacterium]
MSVRIVVDATSAVDRRKTGIGWYTRHLIRWLPEVDPEATYVAWYLHFRGLMNKRRYFEDQDTPNLVERGVAFPGRIYSRLNNRLEIPKVEWFTKFDALFAPNYLPPATNSKGLVLTVHDLAFKILPETAPHVNTYWLTYFDRALKNAAEIVTVSEATRRDLIDIYDVAPERVTAVLSGVDMDAIKPAAPEDVETTRTTYGVDGPYFLFIGGLEPRKNLRMMLRAFGKVPDDVRPNLVLAGSPVPWVPGGKDMVDSAVRALPPSARDQVILTGYVSEAEKLALLTGAEALVYPSVYEGFGLPVLEAMACGTPVLTSDLSSLPEVVGDDAVLVDPYESGSIADGMERLMRDAELRARLREAGPRRARTFSWEETARQTAKVLHRAAQH